MVPLVSRTGRSTYYTIYKYILFEFLFSFAISFLFFFFIFFVNQLLLMAEEILSKSVSIKHVSLIVFYSLPSIIAFTLPFSSLVGSLMAIGRLSSDNEILVMQASGISHRRLFFPFIVIGILLSAASFITNDYFLPVSTIRFGRLYREILYSSPELELESYSVKRYQDSIIITGDVNQRTINNLVIIDKTEEQNTRVITAGKAELSADLENSGVTSLNLSKVKSITPVLKQRGDFNYFTLQR